MNKILLLFGMLFTANFANGQEILQTEKLPEVVIKGTGDINLILLPCMSCRWNEWEEFMDRNAEKYKMFAVTIPGYGGTPVPDLPMNTAGTPWRENALAGLSELIDEYDLKEVTVIGHSWGCMLAVNLAAKRKDVIKNVISVDGTIESTSWVPTSQKERLVKADQVIQDWGSKLSSAEEWSKFNGASVGNVYGKKDSVRTDRMLIRIKLLSSFMATDRTAMLQYWRENMLVDLTADLHQISAPILDIQSFAGKDQKKQKEQHLKTLALAKAPSNVKTVIMYDTKHFIMYHRPQALDCLIADFILGNPLSDFAPAASEYFEEEAMN